MMNNIICHIKFVCILTGILLPTLLIAQNNTAGKGALQASKIGVSTAAIQSTESVQADMTTGRTIDNDIFSSFRGKKELTEKRDRTSKHFLNDNGSTTALISSGEPIHYLDGEEWKEIKNDIESNTTGRSNEYEYSCIHNEFKSFYSSTSDKGLKTELREGDVIEWKDPEIAWLNANGRIIGATKPVSRASGTVKGESITYKSAFSGIDVRFTQTGTGHKLEYVISSREALGSRPPGHKALVFYETIVFPEGWTVKTRKGGKRAPDQNSIQEIYLVDQDNKNIVLYKTPVYYENGSAGPSLEEPDGCYTMEVSGNTIRVGIKVPSSWLVNPARQYPVTIDPSGSYYPDNTNMWTCYIYDDGTDYSDQVIAGWVDGATNSWFNSYSRFNISGIPDVSTIDDVDVYFNEWNHEIGDDVGSGSEEELYQVGFNSSSGDFSWIEQIIATSGSDPDIIFTEASLHPTGYNPTEGTHLARFNSYTCSAGGEIALKQIIGFSTVGYTTIMLYFDWVMEDGYSGCLDRVEIDYSTNGFSWTYFGYKNRYDPVAGWYEIYGQMPAGAENQPTLYLRFRFISDYGNDCHLDNVRVTGIAEGSEVNEIKTHTVALPIDPLTRTGIQKYNDIETGSSYGNINSWSGGSGWHTRDLGTNGNTDLEGNLGVDWFAVGLNTYYADGSTDPTGADESNYVQCYGHSSASYKPYLAVTYTECTDPVGVSAGPDQDVCADNTTLAGSAPGGGESGQWTVVMGTGSFTDDTDEGTTVTNVSQGDNIYRWTVSTDIGGCYSYDDVQITNSLPTTADAGDDQDVCEAAASLNGNGPVIGAGAWTTTGSGIFTNDTLYNTTVSNLDVGANTFTWTITNGSCTSDDEVVVTYYEPPDVDAGPDQEVCSSTATLAGNDPAPGTGAWTVISGSGTFDDNTQYNTDVSGLGLGDNIFRWTVTENGCPNQDNVIITNNSPPTANAGPDQTISTSSTTLAGNDPSPGTGLWTVVSGLGTFTDDTQYNTTVTGVGAGVNEYQWTISNGSCPSNSDNVIINYDAGDLGLIISGNLTNNGTMIQSDDPNYFIMNGTTKNIYGGDATNNTYTDTKLEVKGTITYDGVIDNGKFSKTWVYAAKSFTVNDSRRYKNHYFENDGTTTLNDGSFWENSGEWNNTDGTVTVNASLTPTVIFNGSAAQDVTSGIMTNDYGNVEIDNSVTPAATDGVVLQDNMTVASQLKFTDGTIITNGQTLLVSSTTGSKVIADAANTNYTDSWVYGTIYRNIASNTDVYDFPVGNATDGYLLKFTNSSITGTTQINATFEDGAPTNPDLGFNLADGGTEYTELVQEGTWDLTPDNPVGSGTYDLQLYFNDFVGLEDYKFGVVSRADHSVAWDLVGDVHPTLASSGYAERQNCASFSKKGIARSSDPLYIELLFFEAVCMGDHVALSWATAIEVDNDYFTIEKSTDGISYKPIAQVNGAGNSSAVVEYFETDNDPYDGMAYYRLKQTDYNGDFEYFDPKVVECSDYTDDLISFNVYPNPAVNDQDVYISLIGIEPQKEVLVVVKDILGNMLYSKVVFSDYTGSVLEAVDPENRLVPGIYLIIGTTKDEIYSKKFIIK